jgi:hypothetical protein
MIVILSAAKDLLLWTPEKQILRAAPSESQGFYSIAFR